MGIDVSKDKEVTFNGEHERRVVTSSEKNPKMSLIGSHTKLSVFSIYQRTKFGDSDRDGNPLMYALKNVFSYTIAHREIYKLKPSFINILDKIEGEITTQNSTLVVMPSSTKVVTFLANRIARKLALPLHHSCFMKRTTSEVLDDFSIKKLTIKSSHKRDLNKTLSELRSLPKNTTFTMKKVPNKVRLYFSPWKMNPNFNMNKLHNKNIILVDDLLSTGCTLSSAMSELSRYPVTCNTAICLLSNL